MHFFFFADWQRYALCHTLFGHYLPGNRSLEKGFSSLRTQYTMQASAARDPARDPKNPIKDDDHGAGRRAREVYRYFRPESLAPITEYPTPSNEDYSLGLSRSHGSSSARGRSPSASPQASGTSLLLQGGPAPSKHTPGSLVLGKSNNTLTSLAQLAALRLDVERVFIR